VHWPATPTHWEWQAIGLSVQELSGRTVQYAYDDLYRLTSETIAGAAAQNGTVNYQYDAVGNRKQLTSTVAAIPATGLLNYDANDRLSTQLYDNNGNTVNNGTQNVYDFENRLVRRGNVQIVYDGDGNRVSETVGGATVSYLVADVNPTGYPQVVQERQNQFGPILKNYQWGLQLIAEGDLSQSPLHYYGMDGHGSVRYLTDASGAITDTYDYDAFGNLIAQTGTTANNYLFAGEQFDPALGVYYNRARYYDERLGRFWSADTNEGNVQDPISLHRYLYTSANPANRIDPSGNFDLGDVVIASGIIGALSGAVSGAILGGPKGAALGFVGGAIAGLGFGAGLVFVGGFVAGLTGVSIGAGIYYSATAANLVFLAAGIRNGATATDRRQRDVAVFQSALAALALLIPLNTPASQFAVGSGTFTNLDPTANADEIGLGQYYANRFSLDLVRKPPVGSRGAGTADFDIAFQGKTLEYKNLQGSSLGGVVSEVTGAQGDSVIVVLRPGQFSASDLAGLEGRIFSPNAPGSPKNFVQILFDNGNGFEVGPTLQRR